MDRPESSSAFEEWRREIELSKEQRPTTGDDVDWSTLRSTVRVTYRQCAWCGREYDGFHIHEALVKRSATVKKNQHLLFKVENCVPLHPDCHLTHGQTTEMSRRCLAYMGKTIGYSRIGKWYRDLWSEHNLPVPRGLLKPLRTLKGHEIIGYCKGLPEEGWVVREDRIDYRVWVGSRWQGTRPKWSRGVIPLECNGYSKEYIQATVENGYWKEYLEGIYGIR